MIPSNPQQSQIPHIEQFESFIYQVEGSKTWKIFKNPKLNQSLDGEGVENAKISEEHPIIEAALNPGDFLYIPKGANFETLPSPDKSLHLKFSFTKKATWSDFITVAFQHAIQAATVEDKQFQQGLPRAMFDFMGLQNEPKDDDDDQRRPEFIKHFTHLMKKLINYVPLDKVVDDLSMDFYARRLPPTLDPVDKEHQVHGSKAAKTMSLDTQVRLVRKDVIRMTEENGELIIEYNLENPRASTSTSSFNQEPLLPKFVSLPIQCIPAIQLLRNSYPDYTPIRELLVSDSEEESIELAELLFEKGLIITISPEHHSLLLNEL